MLYDFIISNREELVARARGKVATRPFPAVSNVELEHGVPLFLTQLAETLRLENTTEPLPANLIGSAAAKHGRELLAMGFTVSQVVHDYGDVCQAITELAVEQKATISVEDFHTLNRCLDTAIAEAVTEFGRLERETSGREEVERLGRLAHELRNHVQVALLSFHAVKSGTVAIGGSTGAVLGRSLIGLRDLIDSALAEVRLEAGVQRRDRLSLNGFVQDLEVAANLHADYRDVNLTVAHVDPGLVISVDPQLLASAVMNLLHNAFKYTQANGRVVLRTRAEPGRVLIEVEDECGGLPETEDVFRAFGDRRKTDRSGLGLGLSISRRAVLANGGEIRAHNIPGKGCIFTIDLPASA
jgi:signal transduction histidine kinase